MGANNGRLQDTAADRKVNSSFSHDSDFSVSATSVEYSSSGAGNSLLSSKDFSYQDVEGESAPSEFQNHSYHHNQQVQQQQQHAFPLHSSSASSSSVVDANLRDYHQVPNYYHLSNGVVVMPSSNSAYPHHHYHHHAIVRCPNNRRLAPTEHLQQQHQQQQQQHQQHQAMHEGGCTCNSGNEMNDSGSCSGDSLRNHPASARQMMCRMSPRVYANKPPAPTNPNPVLTQVNHGRTSPGPDLGYHTLVAREILSPNNSEIAPLQPNNSSSQEVTYNGRRFANPSPMTTTPTTCCWDVRSYNTQGPRGKNSSPRSPPPQIPTSADTNQLLTAYKGKRLPKSSPFDRLSDEILLKIFSFFSTNQLCTCARVCRRWYFLTWEPQLWTTIEVTGEHVQVDRALRTIFQLLCRDSPSVCLTVEKIVLSGCVQLSDKGLMAVAQHCPELRHVEIKGCHYITNEGLLELVSNCLNIEYLDLTGCNLLNCIDVGENQRSLMSSSPEVGESSRSGLEPPPAMHIPSRHLYIQFLDMTDCHSLEDPGLKVMVRNCPQLTHLYLRRCVRITDVGMKYIASFCVVLRELSVSDCAQLTDFGLYELAKLGTNLRYISVAKCERMSDAGIKQIARHCYKLRYLNCRGCEAVSDDSLTMLARSCPRLRALDVGKCDVTDYGLKLLSENCLNLRKLSVKSCDMVTDKGIQTIAYYCRGLQQLNIQDCQITIDGYRTVKKFCKRCIIEHTNPGFY